MDWRLAEAKNRFSELVNRALSEGPLWGELTAAAQKRGGVVSANKGLISATARRHGLHVMTRNIADFEPTGVMLINPWEGE